MAEWLIADVSVSDVQIQAWMLLVLGILLYARTALRAVGADIKAALSPGAPPAPCDP